jgi:hypothetical protein
MARKLAVRFYWMLRLQVNHAQLIQDSHGRLPRRHSRRNMEISGRCDGKSIALA